MPGSKRLRDFEASALPHLNDLYRTAVRLVQNPTEAEDIVQEAYFQAWKSFDRFTLGTNCRAWLFKILFHVIQHHRRKWFRIAKNTDHDVDLERVLVYEKSVPAELCDEDILAAVARLPQHYREVVLLADVEEFSYKEIADILAIPIGTVMSRLNRGRSILRVELHNIARSFGINVTKEKRR